METYDNVLEIEEARIEADFGAFINFQIEQENNGSCENDLCEGCKCLYFCHEGGLT